MSTLRNSLPQYLLVVLGVLVALLLGLSVVAMPIFVSLLLILPLFALFYFNTTVEFRFAERAVGFIFPLYVALSIVWPRYLALKLGGPDVTPARSVLLLLVMAWAFALVSPSYRHRFFSLLKENKAFSVLLGMFIGWRFLSATFSESPLFSYYNLANEFGSALLLGFITLSTVRTPTQLWRLLHALVVSTIVVLAVGTIEKLMQSNPFEQFIPPGLRLSNDYLEQALSAKVRGGSYRIQSTFSHPLLLVEYIAFVLPLTIYVALASPSRIFRLASWIAIPYLVTLSVFTGSRSALVAIAAVLALLAAVLVIRAIRLRQLLRFVIIASFGTPVVVLSVLAAISLSGFDMSFITGRSIQEMQSSAARVQMLASGIPLVFDNPVFGHGVGLSAFVLGFVGGGALTIDNYYLTLALDSGLPGLLVFIVLAGVAFFQGILSKATDGTDSALLSNMLAISIVGMLVVMSIMSISYALPLFILAAALVSGLSAMQRGKSL